MDIHVGNFMIMKAVPGETLYQAFPKLSETDLNMIADQVATHAATLARFTSPRMSMFGGGEYPNDDCTEWASPFYLETARAEGFPMPRQPAFTTTTYPLLSRPSLVWIARPWRTISSSRMGTCT